MVRVAQEPINRTVTESSTDPWEVLLQLMHISFFFAFCCILLLYIIIHKNY